MLVFSGSFACFNIVLLFIYYSKLSNNVNRQNLLLLLGSSLFYILFSPFFFLFLMIEIGVSYWIGKLIFLREKYENKLWISRIGILLQVLFILLFKLAATKFYNNDSFGANIYLPLGFSFYSFRIISYYIEIKRGNKLNELPSIIDYACYISFFPLITSGPINRPFDFLPQIKNKRSYDEALISSGFKQILWGVFKKIIVADNIHLGIENVLDSSPFNFHGSTLILTYFMYLIEMYADFSGYSDIAIGLAKCYGINVKQNFNYPLFAKSIPEYWRKWHISLTSWLTDYVFMPLNLTLRNYKKCGIFAAIIADFAICGLWHGLSFNYLIWGIYHALAFVPFIFFQKKAFNWSSKANGNQSFLAKIAAVLCVNIWVSFGMIFFVNDNLANAKNTIFQIFSKTIISKIDLGKHAITNLQIIACMAGLMFVIEFFGRKEDVTLQYWLHKIKIKPLKWAFVYLIFFLILFYMKNTNTPFLYDKF